MFNFYFQYYKHKVNPTDILLQKLNIEKYNGRKKNDFYLFILQNKSYNPENQPEI